VLSPERHSGTRGLKVLTWDAEVAAAHASNMVETLHVPSR
jgi:hypothetical protein